MSPSEPTGRIVEFNDPGCPFAFSAEPHRLRLRWLFGDAAGDVGINADDLHDWTAEPDVAAELAAGVIDVLRWAGYPLATQEVAEVCQIKRDQAHEQLVAAGAEVTPVATDGYWHL